MSKNVKCALPCYSDYLIFVALHVCNHVRKDKYNSESVSLCCETKSSVTRWPDALHIHIPLEKNIFVYGLLLQSHMTVTKPLQ